MNRKVLCLDWDKRTLRLVVARVGGLRTILEDAHSHRLPENADADEPEALGEFIRAMLRRHKLHHKSAVVDVPRERAVINRLTLPPTPLNEVAAAVRFQAMKELPFPLDTAAMDYVVTVRDEKGLASEALIAAVTLETLDRIRRTCSAAGLTPERIGLRPYANLVSVRQTRGVSERRVLLLDVGPVATEIDVFHGERLAFARSANVTVPLVIGEAGVRTDSGIIPMAEAREAAATDENVNVAVMELLVEATRTAQAYRASEPDAAVDEIVVAGGTGVESQLARRLAERLNLPVHLFDPCAALNLEASEAPKLRSFSAALGLAWSLGREGFLAIDFLNPKRPVSQRETLQKRARLAVLGAAVVLIAVGGVLAKQYHALRQQRDDLRTKNKRLLGELEKKIAVLNRTEEVLEWAEDAVWPDELLNIVQQVQLVGGRPGEKLVAQELTLDTVSRTPGITLRNVHATEWQVLNDVVNRLNGVVADEQRLYEATLGVSNDVRLATKYKTKSDIRVQLHQLQKFRDDAAKRAKARKDRVKEYSK